MQNTSNIPPFRAETIGSFIRTEKLVQARNKFEHNAITAKALKEIENQEIKLLVEKQIKYGLKVVTDGEFRKKWAHIDFFAEIQGLKRITLRDNHYEKADFPKETVGICDELKFIDHSVIEDFIFLNRVTQDRASPKVTVPAPSMLLFELLRTEGTKGIEKIYPSIEALSEAISKCAHVCIQRLYDAGCRHIQMNNNIWGVLLDENIRNIYKEYGYDVDYLIELTSNLNINSFSKKPDDMAITMHVCRGNNITDWTFSGSYEPIADALFSNPYVHGFYLEYDTDSSGGFEPLRYVRENQKICLGLISTKNPKLEDEIFIKTRIFEAAQYIGLENLALSPQCGFDAFHSGSNLTEEDQWRKIAHVVKIAKGVWDDF